MTTRDRVSGHPCGRRAGFSRLQALLLILALLACGLPERAAAVEYEWGDLRAQLDSYVSLAFSLRTQGRDCLQIAQVNGGCNTHSNAAVNGVLNGRLLNSDDGNLNVDRGDLYSLLATVGHDLDVQWRNYGAFVRVLYFFDAIQSFNHSGYTPRRTDLSHEARFRWSNVVDGGVVGADVRLLDAWAYAGFDWLGRSAELRFGNQVINWGEEYFTQGGIKATNALDVTKLRVAGSELKDGLVPAPIVRLSTELLGSLSLESYYQFAWNATQIDPVGSFFSVSDLVGRGAEAQFTAEDPGSQGTSVGDLLDRGLLFGGVPRGRSRSPDSQGQWGAALRYFADPIQTEFAVYYVRFHDKQPNVSYRGVGTGTREIQYFEHYAEDINLYGASFNTAVGWLAVGGEVSLRTNQPTPITDAFTRFFFTQGGVGEERGYVRERRVMAILNALGVVGPGTPVLGAVLEFLHADDLSVIGEFGLAHYPDLDRSIAYAPPNGVVPSVSLFGTTLSQWHADPTSFGYQLRLGATYNRVFGTSIVLMPSLSFRHDAYGTTPDSGVQFSEGVKQIGLQLEADYQNSWGALVTYSNSFGGGRANTNNDRDFIQLSISHEF